MRAIEWGLVVCGCSLMCTGEYYIGVHLGGQERLLKIGSKGPRGSAIASQSAGIHRNASRRVAHPSRPPAKPSLFYTSARSHPRIYWSPRLGPRKCEFLAGVLRLLRRFNRFRLIASWVRLGPQPDPREPGDAR